MTKRKLKKEEKAKSSSRRKGELVERIVAMMHEGEPQVTVRRDVRLPAKHGGKRSRQIDVLLEGHFAGYPTMHAVECKNFKRPVDVGDIGRFRDLLEDVGLYPTQGEASVAFDIDESSVSILKETEDTLRVWLESAPNELSAGVDLHIESDDDEVPQGGKIVTAEFKENEETSATVPAIVTVEKWKYEIVEYPEP